MAYRWSRTHLAHNLRVHVGVHVRGRRLSRLSLGPPWALLELAMLACIPEEGVWNM
jgi:hypothetical protein